MANSGSLDERFNGRVAILDEYFPIDPTKDKITPPDPETGQKSWEMYIKRLAQDSELTQELATRALLFL